MISPMHSQRLTFLGDDLTDSDVSLALTKGSAAVSVCKLVLQSASK